MFLGRFFHKINAKHQTSVPASLREQIPEGQRLHFVRSDSDCLFLYTQDGVARLTEKVHAMTGRFDSEFRRMFTSDIMPVDMDSQGRIDMRSQWRDSGFEHGPVHQGIGANTECDGRTDPKHTIELLCEAHVPAFESSNSTKPPQTGSCSHRPGSV